jgi:hypothetical protein
MDSGRQTPGTSTSATWPTPAGITHLKAGAVAGQRRWVGLALRRAAPLPDTLHRQARHRPQDAAAARVRRALPPARVHAALVDGRSGTSTSCSAVPTRRACGGGGCRRTGPARLSPAARKPDPQPPTAQDAAQFVGAAFEDPDWGALGWPTITTGPGAASCGGRAGRTSTSRAPSSPTAARGRLREQKDTKSPVPSHPAGMSPRVLSGRQ